MYSKKNHMAYLIVSIVAFLVFSISFLLMPVEAEPMEQGTNVYTIVAGLMFWIGLVVGILMQVILSVLRRNWFSRNRVRLPLTNQPKLGLISFFKNKTAVVFDVMLIISIVGLVIAMLVTDAVGYSCYVFMTLTCFSFCSHCIFNGKIYYFIENKDNMRKALEKAKSNA